MEKGEAPVSQNFNPREDELEANWEFYPLIQKVYDGDYPSDDSLYKEMSARLRNLYESQDLATGKYLAVGGAPALARAYNGHCGGVCT